MRLQAHRGGLEVTGSSRGVLLDRVGRAEIDLEGDPPVGRRPVGPAAGIDLLQALEPGRRSDRGGAGALEEDRAPGPFDGHELEGTLGVGLDLPAPDVEPWLDAPVVEPGRVRVGTREIGLEGFHRVDRFPGEVLEGVTAVAVVLPEVLHVQVLKRFVEGGAALVDPALDHTGERVSRVVTFTDLGIEHPVGGPDLEVDAPQVRGEIGRVVTVPADFLG